MTQKPYRLVVRRTQLDLQPVQTLIETLGHASFRREVEACVGYDMRTAGDRLIMKSWLADSQVYALSVNPELSVIVCSFGRLLHKEFFSSCSSFEMKDEDTALVRNENACLNRDRGPEVTI